MTCITNTPHNIMISQVRISFTIDGQCTSKCDRELFLNYFLQWKLCIMSAIDLATDEGFYYVEDDDHEDHELGTGDDCEDGGRSSSSDEEGGHSSQPVDYSDLQLEQDRRTRRRKECRGGLRPDIQRPISRRSGGATLGGEPAWRQGCRGIVAGITLFKNPAPGGGRVHTVQDPLHQSQPTSEGFNSRRDGVQLRSDRRFPRRHREKKNGNWTDEQLRCAMAAVDNGKTMKKAAEENIIPYSSFRDHCYGKTRSRKRGVHGVLTPEEEQEIVDYLVKMCDMGCGLSPSALKMKVYEITKHRLTPFRDGIPGRGWMRWFRFRHPELTLRAAQGLESARARALCPENVQTLYKNLERLYSLHNYPPERIWKCDESGAQAGNAQAVSYGLHTYA